MKTIVTGCVAALAAAFVLALTAPAGSAPLAAHGVRQAAATEVVTVAAARRKHPRRAYVDVPVYPRGPVAAPGCPGLYSWNPANPDRGFCDPGFAYHGNINGCAIDEGYGRWSPCEGRR